MITSENNKLIKDIVKLKQKKYREKNGLFYIEGERIVDEIPEDVEIYKYIFSEDFYINMKDKEKYKRAENIIVTNEIFKKLTDTINPQGIMAICKIRNIALDYIDIKQNGFYIILDRISDPGNMGTIIRTGEALGADCIFLSKDCVDLYNSKTIRSTMGSIFHIPIIQDDLDNILPYLKQKNISIACTDLSAQKAPYEVDFKKGIAILIGNEANGVLEKYKKMSDILVKIPMLGKVESMNASISSAIMFYEVLSQRLK